MTADGYTGVRAPELNLMLDRALAGIAEEIGGLHPEGLAGVVLGGGYGRGEGGVLRTPQGDRLYNDLDLFVFGNQANRRQKRAIGDALKKISEKWKVRLGVEIDFSPVKNLDSLRRAAPTLMFQELLRGWRPVWGDADPARWIPALTPRELPFTEAVRLLLNRGMGLVFAGEFLIQGKDDPDFIVRNMNKTVLGCGDALLLAAGEYRWSGAERNAAFAGYVKEYRLPAEFAEDYARAFQYKLEPRPVLPDDPLGRWRECRRFYLATVRLAAEADSGDGTGAVTQRLHRRAADGRSLKNLLRWLVKARSARRFSRMFDDPVVSVLSMLFALLEKSGEPPVCPPELYRLWSRFN